jgi:valyl-tRNA synthetase
VVYRDGTSKLFYFKYQIEGSDEFLEVATARPETMFADVALFVNPKDQRYKKYINKNVVNPINNKLLKVYKDTYVDMEFASGVMKCTPAHDFNDYKLAEKHKITDFVSVLNVDGTLNNHAISTKNNYANIERLAARKLIVDELKQNGSLIKVKEYKNKIAYSERSGEIVEPLLSKQ